MNCEGIATTTDDAEKLFLKGNARLPVYNRRRSMQKHSQDVTGLLVAWSDGDVVALEQLMPLVYQELRRLANRHLARERQNHTLDSACLVNEAYLRLVDQNVNWQNRNHFFAIAARLMRRILVDHARTRSVAKRGGGAIQVSLTDNPESAPLGQRAMEVIEIDEALIRLAEFDPRKCEVVELRFFGGLSIEETADVLKISANTVMRDWKTAKAWLHRELQRGRSGNEP
jgi:RNA polymerase sigma-70 factor (ECF subfamily)